MTSRAASSAGSTPHGPCRAAPGREPRLPDPGLRPLPRRTARRTCTPRGSSRRCRRSPRRRPEQPSRPRSPRTARALASRPPALVRDDLRIVVPGPGPARRASSRPRRSLRRFVVSAMSVGALSPEAHQALTIGIQRAGGRGEHGRGRRGPGVVRARGRRRAARRPHQAGRLGALRGHRRRTSPAPTSSRSRSPRARSPARAASCRAARRRRTSRRCGAARPASRTSARRPTTTSTRSRTSPS